jgi:hypothetical protein
MSAGYAIKRGLLLVVLAFAPALTLAQIQMLGEQEMGSVTGGDGIALQLGLYYNMTPDTSNTITPNNNAAAFDPSCTAGAIGSKCIMGVNITNRGTDWLMLKDYYWGVRIFQLNLDAGTITAASAKTGYFNTATFQNAVGACLLTVACTAAGLGTLNAMVVSYPSHAFSFSPVAGGITSASAGYDSIQMYLNLGRLVVEMGAPGDTKLNSYLGARISDNVSQFAGIAVRGQAYVYGF